MIALAIILALAIAGSTVAIIVLARTPQALVARCSELVAKIKADSEQQVKDRDSLRAMTLKANEQEARAIYDKARADEASEQLGKTQIALEAAKQMVAQERQKRIEGMSLEQLLEGVNSEIDDLSERPGTALEKP